MTYTDLIFLLGVFPLSAILSMLDRSAEFKNLIMIVTSLIFFSWGRPFALCLIFCSVIVDWLLGLWAGRLAGKGAAGAVPVILSALMNIGLILVFTDNTLFAGSERIMDLRAYQPLGMAYYGLRGLAYVYDTSRGKNEPERNPLCLLTYMCSYAFMAAGPVVRYGEISAQIRSRDVSTEMLNQGFNSLFCGLGKAAILAPVFNTIRAVGLAGREITTAGSWLGMLSFFAFHYFTFTGLCDMSRGFSLMSGLVIPGNYRDIDSKEVFTGLCKSYNSSVVSFIAEVLHIDRSQSALFRGAMAIVCGGLVGLWYAPSVQTLLVGLAAGAVVCLEIIGLGKILSKLPGIVRYIYMIIVSMVIFGGLYFTTLDGYKKWLKTLVGIGTDYTLSVAMKNALLGNLTLIVIAFFVITPEARGLVTKALDGAASKGRRMYGAVRTVKTVCTALVFVISIVTLVAADYAASR